MTERIVPINMTSSFVAQLVEAIPDSWSDISGHLYAPEAELTSGRALRRAGYRFGRFQHYIEIKADPDCDPLDEEQLMLGAKAPGYIEFDETGYGNPEKFQKAKRIAKQWIMFSVS
jgi:hypothetical protein